MVLFILTYALFATAIIANKLALGFVTPLFLVTVRMLGGGLFLAWYEQLSFTTLWRYKKPLVLIALCTTLLNSLFKAYALTMIPAGAASLMAATDPFITALMAAIMFGEPITTSKTVGILVAAGGLVLLTVSQSAPGYPSFIALGVTLMGIAIGRYGWLIAQRLLKDNELSPGQLNSGMMLIAGSLAFPFAYTTHSPVSYQPLLVGALLMTTFIGNGIAYPLYATLLKNHPATLVSLGGFLIPTFVILFTALASGTTPAFTTLVAAVLIASGLTIFTKPPLLMIRIPFVQRRP
jgi:drug/metabolite transporter (DMT)-like permease